MIKHGMVVHRKSYATQIQNPGQIPVMAVDATLYALAKLVQWNWPHTYGEDKCVLMFVDSILKWLSGLRNNGIVYL